MIVAQNTMRKLDERASVAAAALMIALTAVPMSGEERTPPEPSDADAADDYAYWQQQLRRAGLPSQPPLPPPPLVRSNRPP